MAASVGSATTVDAAPEVLHDRFVAQVARTPGAVALRDAGRALCYEELDAWSRRVAAALSACGVGEGATVGLHADRSATWVAAMLGVLRVGAAVLPLPPAYPRDRSREVAAFARLALVLDDVSTPFDPPTGMRTVRIDRAIRDADPGAMPLGGAGDRPAFVLWSSGSTGVPKLIVRDHASFFHRLRWTWERHPYRDGERCVQKAHATTTHGVYELFEPLLRGTPTDIVPDAVARDLEAFWATLRRHGVTRLLMVPSALRASMDLPAFAPPPLEQVVLMGEAVSASLAARAARTFAPTTRLYSIYGSTEASSTLVCDLRAIDVSSDDPPLGVPLVPSVRAFVLDADRRPVAPGTVGRLFIGGPALFRGYLGDPETAAGVLVPAPDGHGRIYDTHDAVRVAPDGALQYVGRVDDTVKVRGFRVELPEIERALLRHDHVAQAVVVLDPRDGGALRAFVTPATVPRDAVYATVRAALPPQMIPSSIDPVDAFPMTSSGKVDRRRLAADAAARVAIAEDCAGLATDEEARVAAAWERTLGHRGFGRETSFFEAGGTSLRVFTLVRQLRETFVARATDIDEQCIYRHPTIARLARHLAAAAPDRATAGAGAAPPLLVDLRGAADATLPPFFVIASAGGTLGAYSRLAAALDVRRAIVGVRDPMLWGGREPTEGFDAWVARYLAAIRERQPGGPYYLGAYSSAGAFAYEIARRLRAAGEEVALLALIDPLAIDVAAPRAFGRLVMRASYAHPLVRHAVRVLAWMRVPFAIWHRGMTRDRGASGGAWASDARPASPPAAHQARRAARDLSALLELNTGEPVTLADAELADTTPADLPRTLEAHVARYLPDIEPGAIVRLAAQYPLQVRAHNAYRLGRYDGRLLLVEPESGYCGLLEPLLRAHVARIAARAVPLGPATPRVAAITAPWGAWAAHYRSMRDDRFVEGLARVLRAELG